MEPAITVLKTFTEILGVFLRLKMVWGHFFPKYTSKSCQNHLHLWMKMPSWFWSCVWQSSAKNYNEVTFCSFHELIARADIWLTALGKRAQVLCVQHLNNLLLLTGHCWCASLLWEQRWQFPLSAQAVLGSLLCDHTVGEVNLKWNDWHLLPLLNHLCWSCAAFSSRWGKCLHNSSSVLWFMWGLTVTNH